MLDLAPELFDVRTMFTLYQNEIKSSNGEEEQRLEENIKALKSGFTEQQRILLLDIIDDKDLIRAKDVQYYYTKGFRRALILMAECFLQSD